MFRGRETIRFCTDLPEGAVIGAVRQALAGLGRVAIDSSGVIDIAPGDWSRSALAVTALGGRVRRELNEYQVAVDITTRPAPAGWALIVLGTPVLLLGWAAALAPLAARRTAAAAVRQALEAAADALGGAANQRYGRKSGERGRPSGPPRGGPDG